MSAKQPRILASFLHDTLASIDRIDPDLGVQVREAMKEEVLEDIESSWSASWLPVGHDVELTEAFFRVAGRETACRVMHDNLVATFDKPILRPMIEGAMRVLGTTPGKMLRWAPKVWGLLFRDVGHMEVEADDETRTATVTLTGLPPEVSDSRNYLLGSGAAISGVFDVTHVEGSYDLVEHGDGRARIDLRWS